LSWSNTSATGTVATAGSRPYTVNGSRTAWSVYCPTARNITTNSATNLLIDESDRTAHTCFMRGFSEHLKISTSTGLPWLWRRICFTLKPNTVFHNVLTADTTPTIPQFNYADTSLGMTRTFIDLSQNASDQTYIAQRAVLFKGSEGSDWTDQITAQVDTTRVTLKYDKTFRISSGNASGIYREYKLWHPMNKNLVYGDDENGAQETGTYFSTSSRAGMGDFFIVDIIQPGVGGTSTDLLQITPTSRLYWHEK
jgi:hypothetical protein